MALDLKQFDIVDYLTSSEAISEYLTQVFSDGDSAEISQAIQDVARAKGGVEKIAKRTGMSPEQLAQDIQSAGKTDFAATVRVLRLLGVKVAALDELIAA
jgi:probable addiction module antidote protein